jgi:hypothetical protein
MLPRGYRGLVKMVDQTLTNGDQEAVTMNKIFKQASFSGQFSSSCRSRFETPDISRSGSALCAQFGSRLRRVFELPCTENDRFVMLLREIEERLGDRR